MGADKRAAIAALLAPHGRPRPDVDTVERVYVDFRDRLTAAYRARPPVALPGVPEALGTLRSRGIRLALTTGFDRSVTGPLLASLGWAWGATAAGSGAGGGDGTAGAGIAGDENGNANIVDAVICADDVPAGRPAPYMIFRAMELTGVTDVARVLVAGDTTRDLLAGSNAGAGAVVGVLTGALDAPTLGRTRHTHLLAGVADLPGLLTGPAQDPISADA
jgi:phosphoglycolate phosphatase-like HAD superfamily hydrolase